MRNWDVPIGTKMYILFGQEASEMYFNGEPVEEILRLAQDGDMRNWDVPIGTKMYILFGQEASEMYFNGQPLTEILRAAEDGDIEYDLFIFEQGITNPVDLLYFFSVRNWGDYCVIDSEEHFEILNTAGQ